MLGLAVWQRQATCRRTLALTFRDLNIFENNVSAQALVEKADLTSALHRQSSESNFRLTQLRSRYWPSVEALDVAGALQPDYAPLLATV